MKRSGSYFFSLIYVGTIVSTVVKAFTNSPVPLHQRSVLYPCASAGSIIVVRNFRLYHLVNPFAQHRSHPLLSSRTTDSDDDSNNNNNGGDGRQPYSDDTIRVRIWRALASGKELSLAELSKAVGERRFGELRSHLTHVEKQAKTLKNKSDEWRERRGLSLVDKKKTLRLKMRKGAKNKIYVRLS